MIRASVRHIRAVGVLIATVALAPGGACDRVDAVDGPIEITLERTACFGWCPVYTVTIAGDGAVAYEGREYVRVTGKQTRHVDPAVVRMLVRDFEAIDFFSLRDVYRAVENPDGTVLHVTDLPTTFVSLRVGDRFKRIEDYFGGPKALRDLERRIDEIAGTRDWVTIPASPSPEPGRSP